MSSDNLPFDPSINTPIITDILEQIHINPAITQLKVQALETNNSNVSLNSVLCQTNQTYNAISFTNLNQSQNSNQRIIYNNTNASDYPQTLNFFDITAYKSMMIFNTEGYCGINNPTPTAQLSVAGLPIHTNEITAYIAGLRDGDFYYTNVSGDGVLKVVLPE